MSGEEETPDSLFPGFENNTQQFLFNFNSRIDYLSNLSGTLDTTLALISVGVNIFHIIILSRKEMRKSLINMILIAISVNYIIYLLILAGIRYIQTEAIERPECHPPSSYLYHQYLKIFYALQIYSNHSATWLGLLMASLRLIILRFPFNYKLQKVAKTKNGLKYICATMIFCFPISFLYYFRFKIEEYDRWIPDETCSGFPSNYSLPSYGMEQSEVFSFDNLLVYRIYIFTEGVFAKVIPAIFYPILTFFLLNEVRAGRENRERLGTESTIKDKTTRLVIAMTLSHLICDLPRGILALIQSYVVTVSGFLMMTSSLYILLTTLFILNTMVQCFICCALSSNYQLTVVQILRKMGIRSKRKENEVSVSAVVF